MIELSSLLESAGHAGTFAAELASFHLKVTIEETDEWKEYLALAEEEREKNPELLGRALVQSFIDLDEELRIMKEAGMMVSQYLCFQSYFINNIAQSFFRMNPDAL